MPVVHPRAGTSQEPRSIDYVSGPAFDRPPQFVLVVLRIDFQVGVLNDNNVSSRFLEASPKCGALPGIVLLEKHPMFSVDSFRCRGSCSAASGLSWVAAYSMKELACAIGGTVIDDHDLFLDCYRLDAPEDLAYCAFSRCRRELLPIVSGTGLVSVIRVCIGVSIGREGC